MPHKPTKISVTPPLGKRNYRKEYDNYHASPEQKKKRASRNAARKRSAAKPGQDVHHKNGNPLDYLIWIGTGEHFEKNKRETLDFLNHLESKKEVI